MRGLGGRPRARSTQVQHVMARNNTYARQHCKRHGAARHGVMEMRRRGAQGRESRSKDGATMHDPGETGASWG